MKAMLPQRIRARVLKIAKWAVDQAEKRTGLKVKGRVDDVRPSPRSKGAPRQEGKAVFRRVEAELAKDPTGLTALPHAIDYVLGSSVDAGWPIRLLRKLTSSNQSAIAGLLFCDACLSAGRRSVIRRAKCDETALDLVKAFLVRQPDADSPGPDVGLRATLEAIENITARHGTIRPYWGMVLALGVAFSERDEQALDECREMFSKDSRRVSRVADRIALVYESDTAAGSLLLESLVSMLSSQHCLRIFRRYMSVKPSQAASELAVFSIRMFRNSAPRACYNFTRPWLDKDAGVEAAVPVILEYLMIFGTSDARGKLLLKRLISSRYSAQLRQKLAQEGGIDTRFLSAEGAA